MSSPLPSRANHRRSLNSYAQVGVETGVLNASPERLITLLFDGATNAIRQAQEHLASGNISARGQAISKAINIVQNGLRTGLNMDTGGELAINLADLYDYVVRQLLEANLQADGTKLDLALTLLSNIADAWHTSVDPGYSSPAHR
ncbi:MAG: flagellar export chaperone FliS [Corticimicrobacter sp.]|uniref:flagellar export chaperone FliS n=1 Tax=Corticimicrobacter sp. TaxID=2678536 RepID=UPI0032DA40B3